MRKRIFTLLAALCLLLCLLPTAAFASQTGGKTDESRSYNFDGCRVRTRRNVTKFLIRLAATWQQAEKNQPPINGSHETLTMSRNGYSGE